MTATPSSSRSRSSPTTRPGSSAGARRASPLRRRPAAAPARNSPPLDARSSALSPARLVETFPAPDDHVRTLYDNFENAAAKFPDVRLSFDLTCAPAAALLPTKLARLGPLTSASHLATSSTTSGPLPRPPRGRRARRARPLRLDVVPRGGRGTHRDRLGPRAPRPAAGRDGGRLLDQLRRWVACRRCQGRLIITNNTSSFASLSL